MQVLQAGVMAACAALTLAGCATNVATVRHATFEYSGREVEVTRETFTLSSSGPQVRYFVTSNFQRYPCDGTVPDCRKVYERAETFPRERGNDEPVIWIRRR